MRHHYSETVEIWLFGSRSGSQWRFQISVNVHPDVIFRTVESCVTKHGTMMHHYEPECCANGLAYCPQDHRHKEGLYNQRVTLSAIFTESLTRLQRNLVGWDIVLSRSAFWKDWAACYLFKVRVGTKVHNFIEFPTKLEVVVQYC